MTWTSRAGRPGVLSRGRARRASTQKIPASAWRKHWAGTAVGLGSRRAGPRGCRPREGRRRQPRCGMRERHLPEGQEGSAATEEVGSERTAWRAAWLRTRPPSPPVALGATARGQHPAWPRPEPRPRGHLCGHSRLVDGKNMQN